MDATHKDILQEHVDANNLLKNHLGRLDVPSFDSLALSYCESLSDFPNYFKERAHDTLNQISDKTFSLNSQWLTHMNFLYQSWVATKDHSAEIAFPDFHSGLHSYDAFLKNYGENITVQQQASLTFWAKWFMENVVHPERILKLHPPHSKHSNVTERGIYNYDGIWHNIPSKNEQSIFVEERVIREICELNESLNSSEADLFHATGSASLDGISKHNALLSAKVSEKRNNLVKTGEYIHKSATGEIPVGGTDGLDDLYSSAMVDSGYSTLRWFDEYPVVFGFQSQEIREHLIHEQGWKTAHLNGITADGHRIGEVIPLSLVHAVYTYGPYIDSLRNWATQNIPGRKVISIEAATLLRTRSNEKTTLYPNYPYRHNEPVITDWSKLLRKPGIILP